MRKVHFWFVIIVTAASCLLLSAWELCFVAAQIQKAPKCGIERQSIKTLNSEEGKQLMYALAVPSTVKELVAKKAPSESYLRNLENERVLPDEQIVYRLDADVLGFKLESDSDYHIVIADHGTKSPTMIAEIPIGGCSPPWVGALFDKERSLFVKEFGRPVASFHRLAVPKRATVTGVFFFDFLHGQTGVAPNGAELHPVLEIAPR